MNSIKTTFTIKDLENLSGIKAHTIRIWEKRYNLFSPNRSESNFRSYSQNDLQKMLNIAYLNKRDYKISKIASLSDAQIEVTIKELSARNQNHENEINKLKVSMIKYDKQLFDQIYSGLLTQKTFTEIFNEVFIPLLNDIGVLWTTNTISPAHEHFISNLIIQKIQIQTEKIGHDQTWASDQHIYVLFLPLNEIHEIGLLYINYLLTLNGHHTIYLGQSIPLEDLTSIQKQFNQVRFITCFTVEPKNNQVDTYVQSLKETLDETENICHIIGNKTQQILENPDSIRLYKSISDFIEKIPKLT